MDLTDAERESLKKEFGVSDDEIDQQVQDLNNVSEGQYDSTAPEPPRKDDLLRFIRDVLSLKNEEYQKINRIGNLENRELGNLPLTVRSYSDIANYAETEGYTDVSTYLRAKSSLVLDTSLARKGFFIRLPFSQTKINRNSVSPKKTIKKSLFGGTKETIEGEE